MPQPAVLTDYTADISASRAPHSSRYAPPTHSRHQSPHQSHPPASTHRPGNSSAPFSAGNPSPTHDRPPLPLQTCLNSGRCWRMPCDTQTDPADDPPLASAPRLPSPAYSVAYKTCTTHNAPPHRWSQSLSNGQTHQKRHRIDPPLSASTPHKKSNRTCAVAVRSQPPKKPPIASTPSYRAKARSRSFCLTYVFRSSNLRFPSV